jgi:hypothetical protein
MARAALESIQAEVWLTSAPVKSLIRSLTLFSAEAAWSDF